MNIKRDGNTITMRHSDLEMIMGCLATQKFLNASPACGDEMDEAINHPEEYKKSKEDSQSVIDSYYREIEDAVYSNTGKKNIFGFLKR